MLPEWYTYWPTTVVVLKNHTGLLGRVKSEKQNQKRRIDELMYI